MYVSMVYIVSIDIGMNNVFYNKLFWKLYVNIF